jgi:hypothetical protein
MLLVFNDLRRGVGVKHRNLRSVIFEIECRLQVRVPGSAPGLTPGILFRTDLPPVDRGYHQHGTQRANSKTIIASGTITRTAAASRAIDHVHRDDGKHRGLTDTPTSRTVTKHQ